MERLGNDPAKARLLAAFQLTVRGVPFIYYGEELGLPHHRGLPRDQAKDPIAQRLGFVPTLLLPALRKRGILVNRDECRSPMPWHECAWQFLPGGRGPDVAPGSPTEHERERGGPAR
jgi:glycosidase